MGTRNHLASREEKIRLITAYYDSSMSQAEFCEAHGIYKRTFQRWLKAYNDSGSEALKSRKDKAVESIAPDLKSEKDLKLEILRLRIENERLKKNYTVQRNPDGTKEYIRLKEKNSR